MVPLDYREQIIFAGCLLAILCFGFVYLNSLNNARIKGEK